MASDSDSSSCKVGYRPTAGAGTHTITADYTGSALHAVSADTFSHHRQPRDTATTVELLPASVAINQGSVCTVTVDDTDGGTQVRPGRQRRLQPQAPAPATSAAPSCTLVAGGLGLRQQLLPGRLPARPPAPAPTPSPPTTAGSALHAVSGDDFDTMTVSRASTATTVELRPASVAINQGSVCTVTVDDTDGGLKSNPAGSGRLQPHGDGTGNFSSAELHPGAGGLGLRQQLLPGRLPARPPAPAPTPSPPTTPARRCTLSAPATTP